MIAEDFRQNGTVDCARDWLRILVNTLHSRLHDSAVTLQAVTNTMYSGKRKQLDETMVSKESAHCSLS